MAAPTTLDRTELPTQEAAGSANDGAIALVDKALVGFAGRSLLSGTEVIDRLLDLRNALAAESVLHDIEALAPAAS